jgi:hypothetical protein
LHFRVLLFLSFTFGASLAFSSLCAGFGKRTQKPLGAHQERILIAMKVNMAVLIYRPNYEPFIISCVGEFNIMRLLHQSHHFIICIVSLLSFVNSVLCCTKQEESSPKLKKNYFYSQNKENFYDGGAPPRP